MGRQCGGRTSQAVPVCEVFRDRVDGARRAEHEQHRTRESARDVDSSGPVDAAGALDLLIRVLAIGVVPTLLC